MSAIDKEHILPADFDFNNLPWYTNPDKYEDNFERLFPLNANHSNDANAELVYKIQMFENELQKGVNSSIADTSEKINKLITVILNMRARLSQPNMNQIERNDMVLEFILGEHVRYYNMNNCNSLHRKNPKRYPQLKELVSRIKGAPVFMHTAKMTVLLYGKKEQLCNDNK